MMCFFNFYSFFNVTICLICFILVLQLYLYILDFFKLNYVILRISNILLFVLPASSLDILMSDGEEESSFLSLPNSVLQRHCLTSDLSETATSEQQQLIIQV